MNKSIVIVAVLLTCTFALERFVNGAVEHQRVLKGQLHQLPNNNTMTGDAITKIRIERADTAWSYVLQDQNWHYPAYENAFALNDRIQSFARELVESYGTVVALEPSPAYGFDENALRVTLTDSAEQWVQTIQIGNSVPGTDTREAYMKIPQSDTIYHIHADPLRILNWERIPHMPPFLDPKILPTALQRRATQNVVFYTSSTPVSRLRRVEVEKNESKTSRVDGPTYDWYATVSGQEKKVNTASVYAYLGYLGRLKYTSIVDPATWKPAQDFLVIVDDQDVADTLWVGRSGNLDAIQHKTTGHVYAITQAKKLLLFPTQERLEKLPDPTPYHQAEPTGPFSLATP